MDLVSEDYKLIWIESIPFFEWRNGMIVPAAFYGWEVMYEFEMLYTPTPYDSPMGWWFL